LQVPKNETQLRHKSDRVQCQQQMFIFNKWITL
jgi:hypothetical protein